MRPAGLKLGPWVVVLGGALLWSACQSYTQKTASIRLLYDSDRHQEALDALEASPLATEGSSRLLYALERASILDRLGRRKESRSLLLEADRIVDELYTESISKTAASFLINDSTMDYPGEDYEKVLIHTMLALSFLEDGDLSNAAVSARKINNRLKEITQEYPEDARGKFAEDGFALYLSGAIFEARGDLDNAIVDYGKALAAFATSYQGFFEGELPASLVWSQYRLLRKRGRKNELARLEKEHSSILDRGRADGQLDENSGDLIVIHEFSKIAVKQATEFIVPISDQVVRFSFPVIHEVSYGSTTLGANLRPVGDGPGLARNQRAEQVQNLSRIAHQVLEDKRTRLVLKQGARLVAKGQLVESTRKKFGPLAGLAANVWAAATETADTRSWTLLPGAFYLTRVRVVPGEYHIETTERAHTTDATRKMLQPGRPVLLRVRSS